jgi:ATP:ADP antiporter, AAA family
VSRLPAAERAAVAAAALVAGLLIAQQVAGRAVRDALFLSAYSVSSLPGIMLVSALVSMTGALAFAAALARRAPVAVLSGALVLQALLLAGEWHLAAGQPRLVAAALYVQLALLGPGVMSGFWSLVNERFDPHTARRVVGRIGTGASVGGVLGGGLAWVGARLLPVPALLLGLSAVTLLALLALRWLRAPDVAEEREAAGGVLAGLQSIRRFPYLRQLACIVALGALAEVLLDYLLKAGAARALTDTEELARFFSLFYAGVGLVTLAVQAAFARPALERVGLSGTVSVQPATVALACAAGLALPSLAAAAAARGLGNALRDSLFRSAYELFYAPLPPGQKRGSKALVDIAADKLGALLGAGLVLLLAAHRLFSDRWLWALALLAMGASLVLARRLHQGYVRALEQSLRAGLVALEPDEVLDSTTRHTMTRTSLDRDTLLAEIRALHGERPPAAGQPLDPFLQLAAGLRSGDPQRIRGALQGMGSPDPGHTHLLVALLERDDVYPQVISALQRIAPRVTGQLVDALVDAEQPARVRRRVPRVLKGCATPRAVDGLLLGLLDPDFAVRRASGATLAWIRAQPGAPEVPAGPVYAAVARELTGPTADVETQLDHVFALLSAVGEPEPLRVTRWALRGQDQRLRGTALEYLEQVLPDSVRQPLLRRAGTAAAPAVPPRPLGEVEEELRRSSVSLPRDPGAGPGEP